ncbi:MAG: response regulator transcription factor [Spirochaetaceae bacterium]|nr:response regulator transcription factor [Spirochaetaceae bacterium]
MSSQKITVLIADDEAPARNRLKTLFNDYSHYMITGEAVNGDEVLKLIIEKSPQVAFLDINMPGASVFSTIPSLKNPPLVVFQTAYSEFGVQAFDINAVDYLLKPISRERFKQALEKLESSLSQPETGAGPREKETGKEKALDVISIKSGEALRVLKVEKILRISFEDGFSFIHLGKERLYSDRSLNHYEELLKNSGFYRVSRTDMINLKYMEKLHPFFNGQSVVELTGGEKIRVSRRRVQGLKEMIL